MSTLPSISIITPTLNQSRYIGTTIASVRRQAYPNLEYLIVDGGSTDGTRELLSTYGDSLQWVCEPGTGQSAAINHGWQRTSGEVIAWINSDDVYIPDALLRVGEYFQIHPEVDIVYGDCETIDDSGRFLKVYATRPFDFVELVRSTINFIPQPAVFLRRRVIGKTGLLDESLSYVMDFDYWLRAGLHHRIEYLPTRLAALRLHTSAKSIAQLGKFAVELVQVYEGLFARNDLPPEVLAVQREAMANIHHRAADCAFWAGDITVARYFIRRSFRFRPWPPRTLWLWVVLGRSALFLANRLIGNPYLPRAAGS